MPDFLNEDLITKHEVDQLLKFCNMRGPLNWLSVLLIEDANNIGFCLEHSHLFSDHGQAGHYHFNITSKVIHYHGYFLVCNEAIVADPVLQ
jgi:hypothetical protein